MQKITAIVGKNGSGKTLYVEALRKQMASPSATHTDPPLTKPTIYNCAGTSTT